MNCNTPHFVSWDERRDIAHPGSKKAALNFAVQHFIECGKEAILTHGFFTVALSGGSTPKQIYTELASPANANLLDWSKVYLFWSDERALPPADPNSNFRMAMEAGLKSLPIPHEQIFRMEAETDIAQNAQKYEQIIKQLLKTRTFDLVMLGMGSDGHTASLFPGTKALKEKEALVVPNHVPQKECDRMTLTFRCINQANNIVIYILGKEKAPTIKKLFLEELSPYPIAQVGAPNNKALFIIDSEAVAPLLDHPKFKRSDQRIPGA